MLTADDTTSLARILGREADTIELGGLLSRGYADRLGVRVAERALGRDEEREVEALLPSLADEHWLGARMRRSDLDRHGSLATQLGVLEVYFAVDGSRLGDVVLAGDVIASSATVAALEEALRGCLANADAIDHVVREVLADPRHFVLGIGPTRTLTDALVRGLPG
jgi:hypothetical protein